MSTDHAIQGLMFAFSFYQYAAGSFIVTARHVELAEEGLTNEARDDGHPRFQQIDEGGVWAELFEDFRGKSALEAPSPWRIPRWEDDCM